MREGRSSGTRPASWLVLVLPAVIGLPFVVIGLVELAKTGRMVAASAMTQGTVVENVWAMPVASAGGTPVAEDSGAVEGRTAYVPRVAFETPDGERVVFLDGIGTVPAEFQVGETVEVLYDPADPDSARIRTWGRIWLGPVLLVALGAAPLLVAFIVTLLLRLRPWRVSAPRRS